MEAFICFIWSLSPPLRCRWCLAVVPSQPPPPPHDAAVCNLDRYVLGLDKAFSYASKYTFLCVYMCAYRTVCTAWIWLLAFDGEVPSEVRTTTAYSNQEF